MATDLFLYGTLQDPEVLGLLLDVLPPMTPVTVTGWRVAPVRGQLYPGLVRDADARATGHHVRVAPEALIVLDRFEGPAYDRRVVGTAELGGTAVTLQAWVIPDALAHVCEPGTWTLSGFRSDPGRNAWVRAIRRGHRAPRG